MTSTPPAGPEDAICAPAPPARAQRVAWGALLVVLAVMLGLVSAFLVPIRLRAVPLPVSLVLVVAGNIALCRAAVGVLGERRAALLPIAGFLVVFLVVLAWPRPEGDVVIPGTPMGIAYLMAGSISVGLAFALTTPGGLRWRSRPAGAAPARAAGPVGIPAARPPLAAGEAAARTPGRPRRR